MTLALANAIAAELNGATVAPYVNGESFTVTDGAITLRIIGNGRLKILGFVNDTPDARRLGVSSDSMTQQISAALDSPVARIVNRIKKDILPSLQTDAARYALRIETARAASRQCADAIGEYAAMGFRVALVSGDATRGRLDVPMSTGQYGHADIKPDGSLYFHRLSLDAATARRVALAIMNKPE